MSNVQKQQLTPERTDVDVTAAALRAVGGCGDPLTVIALVVAAGEAMPLSASR